MGEWASHGCLPALFEGAVSQQAGHCPGMRGAADNVVGWSDFLQNGFGYPSDAPDDQWAADEKIG
jgi:hypothetical protein